MGPGFLTELTRILQPSFTGSERTTFSATAKLPLRGTLRAMLHPAHIGFRTMGIGRVVGRAASALSPGLLRGSPLLSSACVHNPLPVTAPMDP
jgi:hypothetical protein